MISVYEGSDVGSMVGSRDDALKRPAILWYLEPENSRFWTDLSQDQESTPKQVDYHFKRLHERLLVKREILEMIDSIYLFLTTEEISFVLLAK